jgi:ParB-like chromosome segregation protein Spo0J
MKIELVDLESLVPFINNPRKSLNVDKVASSIKEFGFQQPIVINKDKTILAGHTRYYASKKLELKQVPCVIAELDDIKQKAYRIADNRVAEDNKWDFPTLNLEIESLKENKFNIDILGFTEEELKKFMSLDSFNPTDQDDQSQIDESSQKTCEDCGKKLAE